VGYGKGFYDAFLREALPKLSIGLSLFEPINQITDSNTHDFPLDHCCLIDEYIYFI